MAEGGTRFWVERTRRDAAAALVESGRGEEESVPPSDDVHLMSKRISRVAWAGLRGIEPD
jgi:hypothetical protein